MYNKASMKKKILVDNDPTTGSRLQILFSAYLMYGNDFIHVYVLVIECFKLSPIYRLLYNTLRANNHLFSSTCTLT